jgi:putative FmdB family regulatory protein
MPFYEYRCEKGHTFEVMQKMTDDPVTTCQTCDAKVQRVFHPVAVHFKGSGFYNTDYGKKGSKPAEKSSDSKAEKSEKSEKSETKSESKAETKSSTE